MKVETFKNIARTAADDSQGITDLDMSNLRTAFTMLSPADREQALSFLLVNNFPRTYNEMKGLASNLHSFGISAFKEGVRAAAEDTAGITQTDLSNIRDAFKRLTGDEQQRALAFLADENMPRTYAAVKELAGANVHMSFASFKEGLRAAMEDGDGLTQLDHANARDGFGRLSRDDKTHALEFLLTDNWPRTYQDLANLAGREVHIGFNAFREGMRAASEDRDGMTNLDYANARDAFTRLSSDDQARALAFLYTDNRPNTYATVKELASSGVHVGFAAFREGVRAAAEDRGGMTNLDYANARDVLSRMSSDDRQRAAEFLLTENFQHTFNAVKDLL
jgi:hypothetical protein